MDANSWRGYKKSIDVSIKTTTNLFQSKEFNAFIADLSKFVGFIVINGLFLNYVAVVLFGSSFDYWTFLGYGFAWWYIKEEIPRIIISLLMVRGAK